MPRIAYPKLMNEWDYRWLTVPLMFVVIMLLPVPLCGSFLWKRLAVPWLPQGDEAKSRAAWHPKRMWRPWHGTRRQLLQAAVLALAAFGALGFALGNVLVRRARWCWC